MLYPNPFILLFLMHRMNRSSKIIPTNILNMFIVLIKFPTSKYKGLVGGVMFIIP